jgi:UPF0755 protein
VTAPSGPRSGRHSSSDTDAGTSRTAAELLAAWASDRAEAAVEAPAQRHAARRTAEPGAAEPRTADPGAAESRTADPDAAELHTAEMRALPVMPPASPAAREDGDRPTDGRPAARPAGARPSGGRSAISRPAPDRVSPAPWTAVAARPAGRDLDRELERFADDETVPGTPTGASRPLPGGRRVGDAGPRTGSSAPEAGPAAPPWPSPSPLAAALAAIDARHSAADDEDPAVPEHRPADDRDDDHRPGVFDMTGGLEVVVADDHDDDHHDDHHDDHLTGGGGGGGSGRRGGGRRGADGPRRRRRPVAIVLSLIVLLGLVAGIVVGGQALLRAVNPAAEDYTGAGSGTMEIRVNSGDSLRTIAATLVESDVIASTGPFLDAAEANAAATGIQPGVYSMRTRMSGQSALDLLLEPATRLVTKVTVPEGQTVAQILQRLADETGTPLADLVSVSRAPAELGLPPYANGMLEGFLFPATYDFEPGTTPADMLRPMVARTVQVLDQLEIPVEQRLTVVTKASIVQAEAGTVEQMGMVAQVLENRLADGMNLQLDTTVNYANNKTGITTTPQDRANPSPYNTYANPGLPPGAIDNPGEEALRAVLNPTPGPWRFFVVVDPDTGDTRFAETAEEHGANVKLFQRWLQENPGG